MHAPGRKRLLGLHMSMNQWKDCSHFWICNSKHLTYWSWVNNVTLVPETQYIITIAFEEVKRSILEKDYVYFWPPNKNNYVHGGTLLPYTCSMIFKSLKCVQVTPFSLWCLKKLKPVLFSFSFPCSGITGLNVYFRYWNTVIRFLMLTFLVEQCSNNNSD